jgi:hypothetical protein
MRFSSRYCLRMDGHISSPHFFLVGNLTLWCYEFLLNVVVVVLFLSMLLREKRYSLFRIKLLLNTEEVE